MDGCRGSIETAALLISIGSRRGNGKRFRRKGLDVIGLHARSHKGAMLFGRVLYSKRPPKRSFSCGSRLVEVS